MPISLNEKRTAAVAAVLGGVSAICASVAAFNWISGKLSKKRRASAGDSSSLNNDPIESDEEEMIEIMMDPCSNMRINSSNCSPSKSLGSANSMSSPSLQRGGRKNYRALKKSPPPGSSSPAKQLVQVTISDAKETADSLDAEFSNHVSLDCVQSSLSTSLQTEEKADSVSVYESFTNVKVQPAYQAENSEVAAFSQTMVRDEHSPESPSLTYDGRSEEGSSQDSGKGASVAQTSSAASPADDLVETPLVYEFEIPQSIVGLVIGRQGITIKQFTDRSGAQMIIRQHFAAENAKICTIEGHREQINNCLRLIRRKFPPSRFPELKLTPVMPPPMVHAVSPIVDSIVRLNLPDGVKCEVVVSSLIEPGHFFVQQPTHPSFTSLARLDQYMLAVYNQPNGVPSLPRPIEDGVICAAPVMDGWFRAQTVEKFDENDEVLVKFVDYGGYLRIGAADLRQIRSDFMTLPFQAIECSLAHVKPFNEAEGWTTESVSFFESCIYGKIVDALVVSRSADDTVVQVELFFPLDDEFGQRKFMPISKALVDNGFARMVE